MNTIDQNMHDERVLMTPKWQKISHTNLTVRRWIVVIVSKPDKMKANSYTLGREYRVVRNRYSRLLFTSEDRLCANLHVQEQSTNMTSQC